MSRTDSGKWSAWLWPIVSLVLAVFLVYVSVENIRLKEALADRPLPIISEDQIPRIDRGTPAPPIGVYLPDGQEFVLRTDSLWAPLLLAWYSDDCDPCREALVRWNELATAYPGQFWAIRKASDYSFESSLSGDDVTFPFCDPIDTTVLTEYKVDFTPQTMVITTDGVIGNVWFGQLDDRAVAEISAMMGTPYREEVNQ